MTNRQVSVGDRVTIGDPITPVHTPLEVEVVQVHEAPFSAISWRTAEGRIGWEYLDKIR